MDYDQAGTDNAEFIELYNAGTVSADLSDMAVVLINGSDGSEYDRIELATAGPLDPGGYLVIAADTVVVDAAATVLPLSGSVQNGAPDGIALITISDGAIVDALSYEGAIHEAFIDVGGVTVTRDLVAGEPAVEGDDGSESKSMIRYPNGIDTGNDAGDWTVTTVLTPGAENLLP